MGLNRKMLKAHGIADEVADLIIEAYIETVDGLKAKANQYEEDAKKLEGVQKQLDELTKDGEDWKAKYEREHSDFEAFRKSQSEKETKAAKESAYRSLLKDAGVSEKRIDAIMKITDLSGVELEEDGKIKDAAAHKKTISEEYSEFIEKIEERGAGAPRPPANSGGSAMSMEEIYAMEGGKYKLTPSERQAELAKRLSERNE